MGLMFVERIIQEGSTVKARPVYVPHTWQVHKSKLRTSQLWYFYVNKRRRCIHCLSDIWCTTKH